ncbi:helix-turn-helix transcriptional regulator [Kineococcus gynurae]|uniref:Helix-turn-helix transcriptional regulator n=1 Tax=Kineococcus gynurae TaxID=452979 RepID=A0ABV5LSH2_9ACTN
MDNRDEVRTFLTTRRAKLSAADAGPAGFTTGPRRVPGLRRGEVAQLAGVSVEYYARLERGNLAGVSESVLHALARALRLDDAERAHLFDLARAAGPGPRRTRRPAPAGVRPPVQRLVDGLADLPAYVRNARLDLLAVNRLARALYAPVFEPGFDPGSGQTPNTARFTFLDPRARTFWPAWERMADETVAVLRGEAGRDPYDRGLSDLVGELSTRSEEFRTRWAAHDVRQHSTGTKDYHHPVVGDLRLDYESFVPTADPALTLIVLSAAAGTPSADGLRLLASWAVAEHPS